MKSLFYFPSLVLNFLIAHLTPWSLCKIMSSSSIEMQEAESQVRNKIRLADYYAKRLMGGSYPLPVKVYDYDRGRTEETGR